MFKVLAAQINIVDCGVRWSWDGGHWNSVVERHAVGGQTQSKRRQKDIIKQPKENNGQICRKEACPREKVNGRIYAAVTVSGLGQDADDPLAVSTADHDDDDDAEAQLYRWHAYA